MKPATIAHSQRLADPFEVFSARCRAKAALVSSCDADLIEMVDEMQAVAVSSGLVQSLGQDQVQMLMSEAFANVRRPGEIEDLFAQLTDIIECAPRPRQNGAARSTIEALIFQLRSAGLEALQSPTCRQRLAELSSEQLQHVIGRLVGLSSVFPGVTDDLIIHLEGQLA